MRKQPAKRARKAQHGANGNAGQQAAAAAAAKKKPAAEGQQQQQQQQQPRAGGDAEIQRIVLGNYSIAVWYESPYPDEYRQGRELFICQRCLKYMRFRQTLEAHCCDSPFPRGRRVYEDATSALYEIDGKEHMLYCQNLCLLSKLFLDQKTIYYDIGSFLFYVLLSKRVGPAGALDFTFVGYFSKEKVSLDRNNLACILVLPPFRGQSYGQLLIELSYELSRVGGVTGGPEQPLSSQGFHSYRSYWRRAIVQALLGTSPAAAEYLRRARGHHHHRKRQAPDDDHSDDEPRIFSLSRLTRLTGIHIEHVLFTLEDLGLLKLWYGSFVVRIADAAIRKVMVERRINPRMRMDPNGLAVDSTDDSDPSSSASSASSASASSSADDDSSGSDNA
ncbi:K(lysine) acetyltransferase [Coemansia sp. RSA 552]|nr:K(lysine) acetyltransferase [Coemansia sp. RSA 552]